MNNQTPKKNNNSFFKSPLKLGGFKNGRFFLNLKKIVKDSPFLAILLAITFILILAFVFYYNITDQELNWESSVIHQTNPHSYRLLDGRAAKAEKSALKPLAVMLENHVESRPVAGLEAASIIYEVIVEGDITRYLAIFDQEVEAPKIGPVRSARPFFVDLAQEWNPVYFHAGGSQAAIDQLRWSKMININEISGAGIYFWRDPNRDQPHDLFTSADLMRRAVLAKEIETEADFLPWLFKNDRPAEESELVAEIEVNFLANPWYQVGYQYNKDNNDYTRYLAGKIHKTEKGIILKANNIVIQHVNYKVIDSYGRLDIDLTSGGEAEIYQDGRKIEGFWRKTNGRTKFYDQTDKEVKFNRGRIWIELVFD